jgi:hypothetical protein
MYPPRIGAVTLPTYVAEEKNGGYLGEKQGCS